MSFTISAQRSGICRLAYGNAYGYPTHILTEAQADAQRAADVWQEPVRLLDEGYKVLATYTPAPFPSQSV